MVMTAAKSFAGPTLVASEVSWVKMLVMVTEAVERMMVIEVASKEVLRLVLADMVEVEILSHPQDLERGHRGLIHPFGRHSSQGGSGMGMGMGWMTVSVLTSNSVRVSVAVVGNTNTVLVQPR